MPTLKMSGHLSRDFDLRIIGIPGHGLVSNINIVGPTLSGDTWTCDQLGEYSFNPPEGTPADHVPGYESVWMVRYRCTWSNSGAFEPRYELAVRKVSGPLLGGLLAWDNFAVVPEDSENFVTIVDQTGNEPSYRSPTSFHTTRYHKNLWMASRHLALATGNRLMASHLPYLAEWWRQFSAIPGQEAPDPGKRIIDHDLYDGLWGWGGDREVPIYADITPPWLASAKTFYDPSLYPLLFPLDVARAPYQSHTASPAGNLLYREFFWNHSPQLRAHVALNQLWTLADTESAWVWLNTISWDQVGIRRTGFPGMQHGFNLDSYKGNWLAVWLCAVTVMESYLQKTGDPNGHLPDIRAWADQAVESVIKAQMPADGVHQDDVIGLNCRPEHAGGIFNSYLEHDATKHKLRPWTPGLFGIAEWLGDLIGLFDRDPQQVPHHFILPTSYEPTYWSMIGLTYYLRNRY